jgi:hypothetical protein
MKMSKMLAAVAVAGLMGMSVQASIPNGYGPVTVNMTALTQNDAVVTTNSAGTITAKVTTTKLKITTKDILALIGDEFGALPDGARLVTAVMGSAFAVLDKDGNVLISNAGSHSGSYALGITSMGGAVQSGVQTESSTAETVKIKMNTIGEFYYSNAADTEGFLLIGGFEVKEALKLTATTESIGVSLKLSGAGYGGLGSDDFVITKGALSLSAKVKLP